MPVTQAPVVDSGKTSRPRPSQSDGDERGHGARHDHGHRVLENADALLEGRLADVSLIEVKEIAVDPSKGLTGCCR